MRRQVTLGVLAALCGLASAQTAAEIECKKTETQAECHDRLKCKADEELADCQKRLRDQAGQAGQRNGGGGDRGTQNAGGDRGGDRGGGGDRGTQNEGGDRGGGDRGGGDRGGGTRSGGRVDRDEGSGPSRRRSSSPGGRSFEANKKFGLGLELGEPSGLSGKVFVTPSGAIDFGLGYVYNDYYYNDAAGLHIYADYLWHPVSLVHAQAFELPFYIGVGGRFWSFDYCFQGVCDFTGTAIGVRVPIGIAFDFNNAPLDIFIQAVPVLDFLSGDYYNRFMDRVHFGADFSAGIRFWFK